MFQSLGFTAACGNQAEDRYTFRAPVVAARRADGYERTVAIEVPGERDAFKVVCLPDAVHTATGIGAHQRVSRAVAERIAEAFIAHRARLAPNGEWAAPGATVADGVHTFDMHHPADNSL